LNGKPVYLRLYSQINGSWSYHDYAYGTGVLLTDQISLWQSQASGFSNVSSGYGTTSTALGSGAVNYPSATIETANGSWTTWCCGYAGSVAYFAGQSSVTITLSGVSAFGFEAQPSPFAVQGMTVTLSDGQTITDNVNGYYGAQFFGYVGKGITSITITDNSGNDFAIGNFYFVPDNGAASVTVASADTSLVMSAPPSSVPTMAGCTTAACNVKKAGSNR
jgi:hypothetical protein